MRELNAKFFSDCSKFSLSPFVLGIVFVGACESVVNFEVELNLRLGSRRTDDDWIWNKSRFNPADGSWDLQMAVFGYWNTRKLFCRLTR